VDSTGAAGTWMKRGYMGWLHIRREPSVDALDTWVITFVASMLVVRIDRGICSMLVLRLAERRQRSS
jgi:hypothetical protein